MTTAKILIDGDWGGDEMQLAAVLLGNQDQAQVIGATAVFGNAPLPQVTRNAGAVLRFLGAPDLAYYAGAAGPTGQPPLAGDNAHGADGLGGTPLPEPLRPAEAQSAVDYILDVLAREPAGTVTLTATGPLTNIAQALRQAPDTMRRVRQIHVMGGCTETMQARDIPQRCGNITPYAEFNFYMAAQDANDVLQSGLPITLFPMNCTQQLTFTPEREKQLLAALSFAPDSARRTAALMRAPQSIDQEKFGIDAVMHDVHTALYVVAPAHYAGRRASVSVITQGEKRGACVMTPNVAGPVMVMETIDDPDALFTLVQTALTACLRQQKTA